MVNIGIAADSRFATNEARVSNRGEIVPLLSEILGRWKRDDLLARLEEAGVPAGPVNTISEAFADPQFVARAMRTDIDGIGGIRTPIVFSDSALALDRRPPRLGEHIGATFGETTPRAGSPD